MPHFVFEESQQFRNGWLWTLIVLGSLFILIKVPVDTVSEAGEDPISDHAILIMLGTMLFVIILNIVLYITRLKTKITDDGISIIYSPFINKPKLFRWEEIKEAYVRKYKPIWEYRGWGIKFGRSGKAYNISGNMGLQLVLKTGKKVLIGTQKPEELETFLKKYIFTDLENY